MDKVSESLLRGACEALERLQFVKDDSGKHEAGFNYWRGIQDTLCNRGVVSPIVSCCGCMSDIMVGCVTDAKLLLEDGLVTMYENTINIATLKEVSKCCQAGAKKYGFSNYATGGVDIARYVHATARHIEDILNGEVVSKDMGINHYAHICANVLIMLECIRGRDYTNSLTEYKEGEFKG